MEIPVSVYTDDNTDDQTDDQADDAKVTVKRSDLRKLEESAKAKSNVDAVERENRLLRAGVNLDSPAGKLLLNAKDLPDKPEELKVLAESVGALAPTTPVTDDTTDTTATDAEKGQAGERQLLATGATSDGGIVDRDPYEVSLEEHRKALASGRESDALSAAVASIREAGQRGDTRVIFDPRNPRQHYPAYDQD